MTKVRLLSHLCYGFTVRLEFGIKSFCTKVAQVEITKDASASTRLTSNQCKAEDECFHRTVALLGLLTWSADVGYQ
jgi:hypothetical protein